MRKILLPLVLVALTQSGSLAQAVSSAASNPGSDPALARPSAKVSVFAQANPSSPVAGHLSPGMGIQVIPDRAPEGWHFVQAELASGDSLKGYVRAEEINLREGPFTDVPENHWAAKALARLKEAGEVTGYKGGKYYGERSFTRYEMAVLLDRYRTQLKDSQAKLQSQIEAIPFDGELSIAHARKVDRIVEEMEGLRRDSKVVDDLLEGMVQDLEASKGRLDDLDFEFAYLSLQDSDQNRRLDELAQTAMQLSGELDSLKHRSAPSSETESVDRLREYIESLEERIHRWERKGLGEVRASGPGSSQGFFASVFR